MSNETFSIYNCKSCGFQFTQDYPDEEDIGTYYESVEYISHSDTSESFSNKIYRIARSFMLRRKRRLIENVSGMRGGTILDIGCGTGHFANEMQKAGWDVKGIEKNDHARIYAKKNFGLDILASEKINELRSKSFDIITLWHVIEHFHEPLKYTSEVFRLLKPGGICFIAIPNSSSYDAEYFMKYWAAYDVPRHLWHFNPDTFRQFSKKTGLEYLNFMNLPLDVYYISIMSMKYQGSKYAFISGILRAIPFSLFSQLKKEKSSSLIYLLRKPEDQ